MTRASVAVVALGQSKIARNEGNSKTKETGIILLIDQVAALIFVKQAKHIVIAEWGRIYFEYFHLIIQTCCLTKI